jgi:hypothetical protein
MIIEEIGVFAVAPKKETIDKELASFYQSGLRAAPDFTSFVNELLLDVVKKEDFLSQYKPFSHLSYGDIMLLVFL